MSWKIPWWAWSGGGLLLVAAAVVLAFLDVLPLPLVTVIGVVAGAFGFGWPLIRYGLAQRGGQAAGRAVLEGSGVPPVLDGPSRLLAPDRGVVPFVGRQEDLQRLIGWCEDGQGSPLRLVTGPGGVGKSRLAAELSDRMARRGWQAVWVDDGQEATAVEGLVAAGQEQVLLVVDYADTRRGLEVLLRQLALGRLERVRVLLLARAAGEWWDRLKGASPGVRVVLAGAHDGTDLPVRVDASMTDQQIVDAAARAFAAELGVRVPGSVSVTGIEDGHRPRILDLHAVSLVAVLHAARHEAAGHDAGAVVSIDMSGVLAALLEHEERYWISAAAAERLQEHGVGVGDLRDVVAAAYLLPPADEQEAGRLLRRLGEHVAGPHVLGWLQDLYPPRPGRSEPFGGLQPDRLAEQHLLDRLQASSRLAELLEDLPRARARDAVAVLARVASDFAAERSRREPALELVATAIQYLDDDPGLLETIAAVVPYPSQALGRVRADLLWRILTLLAPGDRPAQARVRHQLGLCRQLLGHRHGAADMLATAVDLYRDLAASGTGEHDLSLAMSLRYLGVVQSELGQGTWALRNTIEAVEITEHLAARGLPGGGLARTLCDLGTRYHEAGFPHQALEPLQRSVQLHRQRLQADPSAPVLPHLARALMNLSIVHSQLDQPVPALDAIEEAVQIRRRLARQNPDGDNVFLARALAEAAARNLEAGHPQTATDMARESVAIREGLTEDNYDKHASDLATSLRHLGVALREAGTPHPAVAPLRRALGYERSMARILQNTAAHAAVVQTLAQLGATHHARQRPQTCLPLLREAARITHWCLAHVEPEDLLPQARPLLGALELASAILRDTAQPEIADRCDHAAHQLRHLIATRQPELRHD
ncbi:tetratricopeptide repeat protein [Myceligenerans pegani]|uniref:Tetratricopeptide repeat protein n=1 Tax=Myceligenerans pegani TaxID=2776917 RepID=A0ABR9MVF9_9MICO|nr:tetratricopeptide repeat protein [Myceligenerans sp. TRM 65318]MBE1875375.1 tetratricopeptide repeat protein [Myceligenerans sp. TRM 65318]MBE3017646.1 tetratricopeptide repeat protein [Myceligenerans sp. TRM 65318]